MSVSYPKFLEQKFAKKAKELKDLGVKMDADFGENQKFDEGDKEKLDAILLECQNLKTEIQNLQEIGAMEDFAKGEKKSQPFIPGVHVAKSLGDQFVSSESYKAATNDGIKPGGRATWEAKDISNARELKTTFDTAGTGLNSTVNYIGNGGMPVMVEQQRLTVADLFASGETTLNAVPYIREVSFTNAADMVAEGAEKPEATFSTAPASAPVKKIAVLAKITDEMFADFPMMRDYVNNRLIFMVAAKEEQQMLSGTGTGNQITGVLNTSGIQTQPKGGDTAPDAILKAITKVRAVGFFEPDAIVFHPTDWQNLKLLKDLNGQYYGGGPFTGPYGVGGIVGDSFWGLKVVVTTAITVGTALVGSFKLGGQVFRRMGVRLDVANQNEDDFNFNLQTVRVEERLALCIYRPLAFCTVTGL